MSTYNLMGETVMWIKRFFTFVLLSATLASVGSAQSNASFSLKYLLIERIGDRVVVELQVRNTARDPLYEVFLRSDRVAVPIWHAVITPGEVAVSRIEIYVDPAEEPSSLAWTIGFTDAAGRYSEEIVE